MDNKNYFLITITLALGLCCCQPKTSYLDQEPPGIIPELFAPAVVNTDSIELNGVFITSFTEFFFTRIIDGSFVIHHSEFIEGSWTFPEPIHMYPDQNITSTAVDMTITQDGKIMYFLGRYPGDEAGHTSLDIYKSEKIDGKWQMATRVGEPVSTDEYTESYPTVVADGSLYFISNRPGGFGRRDIYRAQYLGIGKFDTPVSVGPVVNSEMGSGDTFVAPDESYIIYSTRRPDVSGMFVSFKENDEWQTPIYLGEPINTKWTDFCPYMSPDNKYFFFSRRYSDPPESGWEGVIKGEVYWVDASVIFKLNK
jgi:hypothetical protein